jgi:hypothetical protein
MEIKFRGKYDKATFFKSVRLANKPTGNQGRFLAIMATFTLISIGILLYRILETGDMMGSAILLIAAIVLGGFIGWSYFRIYFAARKMWANPGTRRALKGQVNNRGITYVMEAGTNEIRWARFSRVRSTEDLVTLIRDDGLLVIFPRHFYRSDADWRKFIRLVKQKVAAK